MPNECPTSNDQSDDWTVYFSFLLVSTVLKLNAFAAAFSAYLAIKKYDLRFPIPGNASHIKVPACNLIGNWGLGFHWTLDIGILKIRP